MSIADSSTLGPVVSWEMPHPLGPLVRYFPNSTDDPPSYGFVVAKGETTLDIMVVSANYRGFIPKSAVRHAHDPNNWKHRSYMGGIWLDVPFNIQLRDQLNDLREEISDLASQVFDLKGQLDGLTSS